jgi:hypothetical protein
VSNLAVHYLPVHGRPTDLQLMREVSNKLVKYAPAGKPDVNGLKSVWDCLDPDGVLILRNVAMSNQIGDVVANPTLTGMRHAEEWLDQIQEFPYLDPTRVRIEGANEVPQWDGVPPSVTNEYNCVFADTMNLHGWYVMLGQINTGWPANTGTDTPSDWRPFRQMIQRASWDGNWIGLHEYFGLSSGPRGKMVCWWAYRYRHLLEYCKAHGMGHPPIVITEMGGLREIQHADGSWGLDAQAGYIGRIDPQRYMGYCLDYAEDSARDGVIAATIFTTDGAHPWIESMDTHAIHELWKACGKQRLGSAPVQPDDAHNVYVPIVVMDGPQVVTGDPHYGDDEDEVKPVIENRGGLVDPLALQAILQVESGGEGFENGKLKIRFEAHVFKDRLGNDALFEQHFEIAAHEAWKHPQYMLLPGGVRSPIHMTQASEYAAFRRACMIDELAAFDSISMGIGQTMGFNAGRLGYTSPQAMYYDYGRSLNAQIIGAVNFILTDDALRRAVNGGDWRTVALLYNGPGWLDLYVPRLRSAYEDLLL